MNKKKLLGILYTLLAISFWIAVITGLLKFPGFIEIFGLRKTMLPMVEISKIHRWSGVIAALFLLATIAVRKKWLDKYLSKK